MVKGWESQWGEYPYPACVASASPGATDCKASKALSLSGAQGQCCRCVQAITNYPISDYLYILADPDSYDPFASIPSPAAADGLVPGDGAADTGSLGSPGGGSTLLAAAPAGRPAGRAPRHRRAAAATAVGTPFGSPVPLMPVGGYGPAELAMLTAASPAAGGLAALPWGAQGMMDMANLVLQQQQLMQQMQAAWLGSPAGVSPQQVQAQVPAAAQHNLQQFGLLPLSSPLLLGGLLPLASQHLPSPPAQQPLTAAPWLQQAQGGKAGALPAQPAAEEQKKLAPIRTRAQKQQQAGFANQPEVPEGSAPGVVGKAAAPGRAPDAAPGWLLSPLAASLLSPLGIGRTPSSGACWVARVGSRAAHSCSAYWMCAGAELRIVLLSLILLPVALPVCLMGFDSGSGGSAKRKDSLFGAATLTNEEIARLLSGAPGGAASACQPVCCHTYDLPAFHNSGCCQLPAGTSHMHPLE